MVRRHELTDAAWATSAPLLPRDPRRGPKWRDHRTVVNGIVGKRSTGVPWRDLPERYGPWQTCSARFVRWRRDGTWDRLLTHVPQHAEAVGDVAWEVSSDSTVARAPARGWGTSAAKRRRRKKGAVTRRMRGLGAAGVG